MAAEATDDKTKTWYRGTELLIRKWAKRDEIEYDSDPDNTQRDGKEHKHKGIIFAVNEKKGNFGRVMLKDENGGYRSYCLEAINVKLPPATPENTVKGKTIKINQNILYNPGSSPYSQQKAHWISQHKKDETKKNIKMGKIQIFIKAREKRFILNVSPNETIENIKARIEQKHGYLPEHQRLSIYLTGKELNSFCGTNLCTLSDYCIHDGSHLSLDIRTTSLITSKLNLHVKKIQIFVKPATEKMFILNVSPNETIQNIKARIEKYHGYPSEHQRLSIYLTGKELHNLRGTNLCTLSDYGIHNGSQLTLNIPTKSTQSLKIDLTNLVPSMIHTSKWRFEYSLDEPGKHIYTTTFVGIIDIAKLLESIGLSHSMNELFVTMKTGWNNNGELIIKNLNQKIQPSDKVYITIKLDPDKTKISTDIEWINHCYSKLEKKIKEPTKRIEKVKRHDLFTRIPGCKSLQALSNYKRFDDYLFDKIDRDIYQQSTEYATESVKINNMIVNTKKKLEKIKTEDQENEDNFRTTINNFEVKMAELEVRVTNMKQQWEITRKRIFNELTGMIEKKNEELHQTFELWTLQQFVEWLKYCVGFDIELDEDVMKKLNMLNLNGSKLHEINDCLLITIGIKDPEQRKLIIKAINDLFDKYGGHKYAKAQLCCICMMNEVDTCLVPCGHMCYCDECGKKSFDHTDKCPICRKDIITLVKTFKAGLEKS